jgi:signal peptidase II
MKKLTKGQVALITIVLVLIVDQAVKIWVKTHMYIGESIRVTDWFYIAFIENNGMAFGMEIFAKLFLTLFRIAAVTVIGWEVSCSCLCSVLLPLFFCRGGC